MPVEFNGGKRVEIYRLDPDAIKIIPELNGRHETPDIEWLIADLLKNGQIQPVVVRKDGNDAVLIAGFSRWRAIMEVNRRGLTPNKMPIFATYKMVGEKDGFFINIAENRMRRETTPIDDAHNMQRCINVFGMSEEEVAQLYFPLAKTDAELKEARKSVKEILVLLTLTPEAESAVRSGRVKPNAATAIAKLSSERQRIVIASDKQTIGRNDVAPARPEQPRAPKGIQKDAELMRRLWAVLEDVEGVLTPDNANEFVEVDRVALSNLLEYVVELRAPKVEVAA